MAADGHLKTVISTFGKRRRKNSGMIHHPIVLVPKLVVLAIAIIVLVILHGILPPEQFRTAVIVTAVSFACFVVVLWIVAAKILTDPNSRIGKAMVLRNTARSADGFIASSDKFAALVGKLGIAVSNLNPSGTALIEKERTPVLTDGEFVDKGSVIEVIEVRGSRIKVRKVDQQEAAS
jgi:membrane-bound ClpP family serine protease